MSSENQKSIEYFETFREVLKLLGNLTVGVTDDLEYENDHIVIRLVRFVEDRMSYTISFKLPDGDKQLLIQSTWFYLGCTKNINSEVRLFDGNIRSIQCGRTDEIDVTNNLSLWNKETYSIKYPISEEQYFQRLTQYDLLPAEWFERIMYNGQYILDSNHMFNSFSFQSTLHRFNYFQDYETDLNNVVQYIIDAVKGLIQEEIKRFKIQGY